MFDKIFNVAEEKKIESFSQRVIIQLKRCTNTFWQIMIDPDARNQ